MLTQEKPLWQTPVAQLIVLSHKSTKVPQADTPHNELKVSGKQVFSGVLRQ